MLKMQFALAFILICLLPVAHAWNENVRLQDWEGQHAQQEAHVDTHAGGKLSFDLRSNWRRDLEKSGALTRSGPYRVGLPLVSFGDNGPKLVLTYLPRARDGLGADKSLMLFLRINLD